MTVRWTFARPERRGVAGSPIGVGFLAGILLGALVLPGPGAVSPARAAEAASADDLLIVDCLLPGKVRRLGTRTTYVTARQAVKTTASDCAIRGGEYTASDRADYRTALQTWLPLGKEGDPEAQTHIGEIFEKGLGVPPQYDLAARWYALAAEQGFARAQLNLGALYEQGLGVTQDRERAVSLFRQASGLPDMDIPYVTGEAETEIAALRQERDTLAQERESLARERDRLRQELEAVRQRLEDAQQQLDQRTSEGEAARRGLAEVRQRLEAELATGNQDRLAEISTELVQRTKEVESHEAEARAMRQRLADLQAQAQTLSASVAAAREERDRDVAQARSETAAAQQQAAAAQQRFAELQAQLQRTESALAEQQARTRDRQSEFADLERQLAEQRGAATRDRGREAELEAQLKQREQALSEAQARADNLSGQVAGLREEASQLRAEAKAKQAEPEPQVAAAGPVIEVLQPTVPRTRSAGLPTVTTTAAGESLVVGKVAAPSGLLALTVNDVEVAPNEQGMFRADVPLVGDSTRVSIVAIDNSGQRSTTEFMLAAPAATASTARGAGPITPVDLPPDIEFGDYTALVIGNNDYAHLPDLETAVNDARVVADILEKQYGYFVTLLENADRYAILSALNELRQELNESSNLLIYYAGHGELDRVNNRGHWLPVDAEPTSTANWISNIQITDVLNAMTVRQVMVVADSCYSGTLTRSALAQLDAGMSPDMRVNWLRTMAEKRSRVVLSSGGVQPVLDSAGGSHSVFAQAFIDVLKDNREITEGQRIFREVSQRVTSVELAARVDQLPQFAPIKFAGHEAGDFFFVPMVN